MSAGAKRKNPEEEHPPAAVTMPAEEKQVENESLSARAGRGWQGKQADESISPRLRTPA